MKAWDSYPADYRQAEIGAISRAVRAGECVALTGLSGAGKSNLLAALAQRLAAPKPLLVDCNRLAQAQPEVLFRQVRRQLGDAAAAVDEFQALEALLARSLPSAEEGLCLIFDRFDVFLDPPNLNLLNNLRVLRDNHKYQLTLVLSTRRLLPADNELAELFFAHTLHLGPLSPGDAQWSANSYAQRHDLTWDEPVLAKIIALSGGYPALLRAACEAFAAGCAMELAELLAFPAVQARLGEFWADAPTDQELSQAGLTGIPLLVRPAQGLGQAQGLPLQSELNLTVMEQRLLDALRAHAGQLCTKDDLIRAVWSEDKVFMQGVRDDSLAQLVRRLREKIEPDPSNPKKILTAPGRGYLYRN
jgi:energy-coupling factor transporter ATP-binding protein EcfA2